MELDFRGTSAHYMVAAYSIYHLVFEAYSRERTPQFFSNLAEIIPDMIYSQKNTEKEADISIYESTYKKIDFLYFEHLFVSLHVVELKLTISLNCILV